MLEVSNSLIVIKSSFSLQMLYSTHLLSTVHGGHSIFRFPNSALPGLFPHFLLLLRKVKLHLSVRIANLRIFVDIRWTPVL